MFVKSRKLIIDHAVETKRPVAQLNLPMAISATDATATVSAIKFIIFFNDSSI